MKRVYRPLLVMHSDPSFRERVRQACGSDYHYQAVSDWDTLHDAVRESPPAALVVDDPYDSGSGSKRNGQATLSPALRALLSEYPSTAVLAALEVRPERLDDL